MADFDIELAPATFLTWPLPRKIDWADINLPEWTASCSSTTPFDPDSDPTAFFAQFSKNFEASLEGFVQSTPDHKLPSSHRGRGQRTTPAVQTTTPPTCRASRQGEVQLCYDLPGQAVLRWYRQLRRLQSYLHAARSAKSTIDAQTYRAELWASIRRSSGFQMPFPRWWAAYPPTAVQVEWIFTAFERRFREFEHWHYLQRLQLLSAKREHTFQSLFQDIRNTRREQIDALWEEQEFTILATDISSGQVHLDAEVSTMPRSTWTYDDQPVLVSNIEGDIITAQTNLQIEAGDSLTQRVHHSSPAEVIHQLGEHWRSRWIASAPPSESDIDRIGNFVKGYMPTIRFNLLPISERQWRKALHHFKPGAAQGADGYQHTDLAHMSSSQIHALLSLIQNLETAWPDQLLEAFVIALAKQDDSHTAGQFRPIVLLPTIYRCWSSIRSRQLLEQLDGYIHEDAFGFIPGRETMQVWLPLQRTN